MAPLPASSIPATFKSREEQNDLLKFLKGKSFFIFFYFTKDHQEKKYNKKKKTISLEEICF